MPIKMSTIAGENERFGDIIAKMNKAKQYCIDQFFPRRCPICDEILEPEHSIEKIHPACKDKLYPVTGEVCMQCGRPLENFTREYCYDCTREKHKESQESPKGTFKNHKSALKSIPDAMSWQGKALYLYQGPIKQTMYRFKYSNKREYAQFFAESAIEKYGKWLREKGIDAIIPVPMYSKKQRVRGYNQAESFAKALSKLTGISVDNTLIRRVVDTTPQKGLNDIERKNNLKNAFQNCGNVVQYRRVLVVDDIYTTGCTVRAIVKELEAMKLDRVYVLCICIGKGM